VAARTAQKPVVERPRRAVLVDVAVAFLIALAGCRPAPSVAPSAGAGTPGASGAGGAPACATTTVPSLEPWRSRVFYEIFVRSFSDSNGDGIGDLPGLTARLDTLNDGDPSTLEDLGVSGISLLPVAEAASDDGDDVIDYTALERDYGDLSTMRSFVQAAHDRGMVVIVDFVINHTSSEHPWFQDALSGGEHRDWYIWSDTDPGWPAAAGSSPWHETSAGDFYYGAFSSTKPDLNLRNPDVAAALTGIAETWLEDLGIDGLRIDAASHLIETGGDAQVNTPETKAWLADFRDAIHAGHPTALVVGETLDGPGISSTYTRDGALDMSFDFGIGPALVRGVDGDATTVLGALDEVSTGYAPGAPAIFLSRPDRPRLVTQLHGDLEAAKQAAAVLLTAPGVPFISYGEELGMTGTTPEEWTTPYPWTGAAPGFGFTTGTPWQAFSSGAETANLASESADLTSVWSAYRDLVELRTLQPALRAGSFTRLQASDPHVAAWLRVLGDQRVLVLHNLGAEPANAVALDLAAGPLCGSPTPLYLYAASSEELDEPAVPAITPTGGLAGYVPLPVLPGGATIVFELADVLAGA
jgi:alpha-amylase